MNTKVVPSVPLVKNILISIDLDKRGVIGVALDGISFSLGKQSVYIGKK